MNVAPLAEVQLENFESVVLQTSFQMPVLVDFWAPWCGPCRSLSPILERLAVQLQGRLQIVKCNTDENPEIAQHLGIRSIPDCKLFKNGQIVAEFQGVKPEGEIRRLLEQHCGDPIAELMTLVHADIEAGAYDQAIDRLQALLQLKPDHEEARLTLARTYLKQKDYASAQASLAPLPETRSDVQALLRLIVNAREAEGTLGVWQQKVEADPQDLEARYQWALALSAAGQQQEAMDRLLEVIAKNKNFGEQKARQAMLTIFEVLGPQDPLVHVYRRKFANLIL
jgi:putative thioredoxin